MRTLESILYNDGGMANAQFNIDVSIVSELLRSKKKHREAKLLELLAEGYNREDLMEFFGLGKQRISQCVQSLRRGLIKYGVKHICYGA